MGYRPEVDGLRAIAVLGVLLFHLNPHLLPGGYLGVDVFFVISGYLITLILVREIRTNAFSLAGFYERRARRILPALFLVLGVTAPTVMLLMWSGDQADYGWSLAAAATFTSNFFFLHQTDYFATASELRPLLHTWSLGVEAQFYLLYPLMMYVIYRWARSLVVPMILGIALLSLVSAHWAPDDLRGLAFYGLPTRAWEFLAGGLLSLVALPIERRWTPLLSDVLVGLGLLAIIIPMLLFDGSAHHPGLLTTIPVAGALLVVGATRPGATLTRLLSSATLVGVGLISYSLYLWHYPVLAFLRYQLGFDLSLPLQLAASVLILMLSWLSWILIERPLRRRKGLLKPRAFAWTASMTSLMLVVVGIGLTAPRVFGGGAAADQRLTAVVEDYKSRLDVENPTLLPQRCFLSPEDGVEAFPDNRCFKSDAALFIWGDSHARALSRGFIEAQPTLSLASASGCPPLVDQVIEQRPKCKKINDYVMLKIRKDPPETIVLHANWALYQAEEWGAFLEFEDFLAALDESINRLSTVAPEMRIVVMGLVPQWHPSLPAAMAATGLKLDQRRYLTSDRVPHLRVLNKRVSAFLSEHRPTVAWYDPIESFCRGTACLATVLGPDDRLEPFAWDYSHLTEGGAAMIADELSPLLRK